MTENIYEIALKLPLSDFRELSAALWNEMERDVENGNSIKAGVKLVTLLEEQIEKYEIVEEQQKLETQIKDLEKRRNELRK